MMEAVMWRLGFGVIYALALIVGFNVRDDRERRTIATEKVPRLTAYIADGAIWLLMIGFVCLAARSSGWQYVKEMFISLLVSITVHRVIFDAIILCVMPALRRRISARACSYLWSIPFFCFIATRRQAAYPKSLLHISLPNGVIRILVWVWFAGFAGVMLWKITGHLLFRRRILKDTWLPDVATRDLWREEQQRAGGVNMDYPLVISPHVTTPLSIGAFRWSIRVVLPERSYTMEELRLIFRHELVHINRNDGGNKLTRTVFAASCWFIPFIWKVIRRSEEDMELSCDETVLLDATQEERQRYARLLLSTAGDERGFTTCLAASAQAMRYRLKNVVQPPKRESGVLVLAGLFLVMVMTFGWFSLGYERISGHELIFQGQDLSEFVVAEKRIREEKREELIEYLAGLEFEKETGRFGQRQIREAFDVTVVNKEGSYNVFLTENQVVVFPYNGGGGRTEARVCSEIDWDYLESFLEPYALLY